MYMQSEPILPQNYSGSAFPRAPQPEAAEPPLSGTEPPVTPPTPPAESPPTPPSEPQAEPAETPASARPSPPPPPEKRSEPFGRFPFLSSLLPPPRHGAERKERSILPDWVLLGAVALLFFGDESNDILPFLLLLLLWD